MATTGNKKRYSKPESVKLLERIALEKLKERYPTNPYLPKVSYTDATSNGLTKCVIDFIKFKGYHAERINSTGAIRDNRKISTDVLGNIRTIGSVTWIKSTTQAGTADISATIKGKSIKIEIKCAASRDRYQSEAQKIYQAQIEAAGGVYLIVLTFEDFVKWFKNEYHE